MAITKKCKFCGKVRPTVLKLDEDILGRKLEVVIENISGVELASLVISQVLVCHDCAVSLVSTENTIMRLREELSKLRKRSNRPKAISKNKSMAETSTPSAKPTKVNLEQQEHDENADEEFISLFRHPDEEAVVNGKEEPSDGEMKQELAEKMKSANVVKQEYDENMEANVYIKLEAPKETPNKRKKSLNKAEANKKVTPIKRIKNEDTATVHPEAELSELIGFLDPTINGSNAQEKLENNAGKFLKTLDANDGSQEITKGLKNKITPMHEDDMEYYAEHETKIEPLHKVKQEKSPEKKTKTREADGSFQVMQNALKKKNMIKERKLSVVDDVKTPYEDEGEEGEYDAEHETTIEELHKIKYQNSPQKKSKTLEGNDSFQANQKALKKKNMLKERKLSLVEDNQAPSEDEAEEAEYDAEHETTTEHLQTPLKSQKKKRKRHNTNSQSTDGEQHQQRSTCVICGKSYGSLDDLRTHMNKNHLGVEQKSCPNCNRTFRSQEKFESHVFNEKCKNAVISCQFKNCDKRFTQKKNMINHMQKKHDLIILA